MSPFEYVSPASVEDAAAALRAAPGEARLLAGGMTLLPAMKHDLAAPSLLVDLRKITPLRQIRLEGGELVVGAMATHYEIATSTQINAFLPVLAQLAGGIGDVQVRYRGTLGGSIANNDPAADYPAACLGLGARIETNKRTLNAEEFFCGLFSTVLEVGEIVTAIRFKPVVKAGYAKFASQASRYALVGVFVAQYEDRVRVSLTGASHDGVQRIPTMEQALEKQFDSSVLHAHEIPLESLMSDLHASAAYRSHLIKVMAKRAVDACLGKPGPTVLRHGGRVLFHKELA